MVEDTLAMLGELEVGRLDKQSISKRIRFSPTLKKAIFDAITMTSTAAATSSTCAANHMVLMQRLCKLIEIAGMIMLAPSDFAGNLC